jgi:arylsulfatase A-like enzyme
MKTVAHWLGITLLLCLAGCGGGGGSEAPPDAPPPGGAVLLTDFLVEVRDAADAPVVGALVSVTAGGSTKSTTTDDRGSGTVAGVARGEYTLTVSAPGFESQSYSRVSNERRESVQIVLDAVQTQARLNVLFVSMDDLNDWISPMSGHPDTVTPNLQRIADTGVTFTNAHPAVPVCNPSRVALMTGRHALSIGVLSGAHFPMRDYVPDAVTLTEHFRNNGYEVVGTGKIFHGADNRSEPWDFYERHDERPQPDQLPGHGAPSINPQGQSGSTMDWGPVQGDESRWAEHRMASMAEAYLGQHHDKPFFLAVGFNLPHLSWYVPVSAWDRITDEPALPPYLQGDRLDLPPPLDVQGGAEHARITAAGKWHEAVRAYLAAITWSDSQLGRILDALESSAYADNTVIVVWGDHGWQLGEKDEWRKTKLWTRSTRTTLLMTGPGVARNARIDDPVTLLDLYPTLSAMADLPDRPDLDGLDLSALLSDPDTKSVDREGIVIAEPKGDSRVASDLAIQTHRWRYITRPGGEELYDHEADPNEWTNLAGDPAYDAQKLSLRAMLARAHPQAAILVEERYAP